jgi:hypothetical protein
MAQKCRDARRGKKGGGDGPGVWGVERQIARFQIAYWAGLAGCNSEVSVLRLLLEATYVVPSVGMGPRQQVNDKEWVQIARFAFAIANAGIGIAGDDGRWDRLASLPARQPGPDIDLTLTGRDYTVHIYVVNNRFRQSCRQIDHRSLAHTSLPSRLDTTYSELCRREL